LDDGVYNIIVIISDTFRYDLLKERFEAEARLPRRVGEGVPSRREFS